MCCKASCWVDLQSIQQRRITPILELQRDTLMPLQEWVRVQLLQYKLLQLLQCNLAQQLLQCNLAQQLLQCNLAQQLLECNLAQQLLERNLAQQLLQRTLAKRSF